MVRRTREFVYLPYFIFAAISLFLLLFSKIGIISFLRTPLEFIFIPPRKILYTVRVKMENNSKLLFAGDLRRKIDQRDEFANELTILKSRIQFLEEENNSMRQQLEAPLPPQWKFVPAKVVGYERFLLIDKGRRDGIKENMVVISQNIVVGKVKTLTETSSGIILLGDPDSKIPAKTDKNVTGLLAGSFGNQIILKRVLQKEPLNTLDTVMSTGEENGFPPNLVIGKVDKVNMKEEEVYKEATVIPLLDYSKLQTVFVVTEY